MTLKSLKHNFDAKWMATSTFFRYHWKKETQNRHLDVIANFKIVQAGVWCTIDWNDIIVHYQENWKSHISHEIDRIDNEFNSNKIKMLYSELRSVARWRQGRWHVNGVFKASRLDKLHKHGKASIHFKIKRIVRTNLPNKLKTNSTEKSTILLLFCD